MIALIVKMSPQSMCLGVVVWPLPYLHVIRVAITRAQTEQVVPLHMVMHSVSQTELQILTKGRNNINFY